jgi:uncharacterized protein (UPF0332 family)
VSRSYYAVLHALKALSPQADQSKTHPGVMSSIDFSVPWPSLRNTRSIRAALDMLQRWREQADYALEILDETQGADAVVFAQGFVVTAKGVLDNDN